MQRIARVEEPPPVAHIRAGQQKLTDMDVVDLEEAFPDKHQPALADRSEHLLGRDGRGQVGVSQALAARGDCAGGDDDDIAPTRVEQRGLADQLHHMRAVEAPRTAGEHTRAELDDDPFVHEAVLCDGSRRNSAEGVRRRTRFRRP